MRRAIALAMAALACASAGCNESKQLTGVIVQDVHDTTLVELNGTSDWATAVLEPSTPPLLRVPTRYLSRDAVAAVDRAGRLVARNVTIAVPRAGSGMKSSPEFDMDGEANFITVVETAAGWGERCAGSIDYVVARQGDANDATSGLMRVLISDSPGHSVRYRYYQAGVRSDEAFMQMNCVFFEDEGQRDTCRIEVMPRPNVMAFMHFDAAGLAEWRQRADDIRQLVNSW